MKKKIKFKQLREDIPKKGLSQEDVIKSVEESEDGYVKIYGEIYDSLEDE